MTMADIERSSLLESSPWLSTFLSVTCVTLVVRSSKVLTFYATYLAYYGLMAILTAFVIPFLLFNPLNVTNLMHVNHYVLRHITKVLGITWELRDGEILEVERGAVIVANHQSSLDILGSSNIWMTVGKCMPVGKKEVFYAWPFGLAAWLSGVVFIDRKNPDSAKKQLEISSRIMQTQKTKIWMFPEGTRNHTKGSLLPFKKGAFRMAIAGQFPILPVVFSPYYFIDYEKFEFKSGKMIIKALAPIPTEGLTMDDVDALTERTRDVMQEALKALSREVFADGYKTAPAWSWFLNEEFR